MNEGYVGLSLGAFLLYGMGSEAGLVGTRFHSHWGFRKPRNLYLISL